MKELICLIIIFSISAAAQDMSLKPGLQNRELQSSFLCSSDSQPPVRYWERTNKHSASNIGVQFAAGSLAAVLLFIPPSGAAYALAWNGAGVVLSTVMGVLSISAYVFGASLGVDMAASIENPDNSLVKTFTFAGLGAGAGLIISALYSMNFKKVPDEAYIFGAASPILGAMVYSLFIADWPLDSGQRLTSEIYYPQKNFSHKDLVEETMLIRLNLFRVSF